MDDNTASVLALAIFVIFVLGFIYVMAKGN